MENNPSAGDRSEEVDLSSTGKAGSARCSSPAAIPCRSSGGLVARYLRLAEPVLRGRVVVIIAIAVFIVAGAVDGRAGLLLASTFVLFHGTYCLLNFWHCRETHCVITGAGWTSLALLGFAAALIPGETLSWYQPNVEVGGYLAILALGYALEWIVAARTGRRALQ
ncbi:hypothetical protein [Qaidamihabitans albus]|uniref:hypothetical protein n=1 Tax=Qaidamihabitans albus TaxID=2795733 RepID=UPI0018F1722F|nr:hypothetical protein [Qaidamihabitans albus]